jgi:hypothetical protein
MLKVAYPYAAELGRWTCEHAFDEHYKFFHYNNWVAYEPKIDKDSWNSLEMVSIGPAGNIVGLFGADIDRTSNVVKSLRCLNMTGHKHPTFSRDMVEFLASLFFKYNFSKVCFTVAVGNPAESMYDKVIERFGGRIVGVKEAHIRLLDGTLRDEKIYEIMKRDIKIGELLPLLKKLDLKIV